MIRKTYGAIAALMLLGFASCSDENPWVGDAGKGGIKLSLQTDARVTDAVPRTRGGDSEYFETPGLEKFYVHLLQDGEIHTNLTHEEFIAQDGFPTGSYTLKAFSGRLEEEGFDVEPYFEGTEEVTVLEGRESVVSVSASLGHTLVSVGYTDEFKSYMKDYSSKLNSEGHSTVDVPKTETRPAFLVPGEVSLWVNFTDPQGRELTLLPAQFSAEAAHHYHVNLNINNGQTGTATLEITFVGIEEQETVSIDLTDELFTAPEPEVSPEGFEDGETLEFLAGDEPDTRYRFNVLSYGGLSRVNLTFNVLAGDYKPAFGNSINLIGCPESVQAQLAAAGFDCKGVFRNPDKMAYIDLSHVAEKLPAGKYEITVLATDILSRASNPVSVKLVTTDPSVKVTPLKANATTHEGTLLVTYNGGNPADISFKAANANGMMVNAPVKSWQLAEVTRGAVVDKDYLFTITLPDFGDRVTEEVEVYMKGKSYAVATVELPVTASFETDAFSGKALIKVVCAPTKLTEITNNAAVKITDAGGSDVAVTVSRDASTGFITVTGLQPGTEYRYEISGYDGDETDSGVFVTENTPALANGNFEETEQTINFSDVQVGGTYKSGSSLWPYTYHNSASIVRSTPTGWGNINGVTCADVQGLETNTWYMVPSTFVEDGKVTIRTVGYNDAVRAEIPQSQSTLSRPYQYYCTNSPQASDLKIGVGELFYGTDASARAPFNCRPAGVTFDYEYTAYNNEKGLAQITVYSGNEVIASKNVTLEGNGTETLSLSYGTDAFGKKATAITVIFKSSSAAGSIRIPTGKDELNDGEFGTPSNRDLGTNSYKAFAMGSELIISNVKLNY